VTDPRAQNDRELALIPRGDQAQNDFRMLFNSRRLNSLGANPEGPTDLRSVFDGVVAAIRATYPDFEPQYDPRLFDEAP